MFLGSSFPLALMGILCDRTGSGNIQDGGLKTPSTYISAPKQDINEIPTATPEFSGSTFAFGLMGILCDQTGSGKVQDGGLKTLNTSISAPRQDINEIPTATPMFSGSSFPLGLMEYYATKPKVKKSEMAVPKFQLYVGATK